MSMARNTVYGMIELAMANVLRLLLDDTDQIGGQNHGHTVVGLLQGRSKASAEGQCEKGVEGANG